MRIRSVFLSIGVLSGVLAASIRPPQAPLSIDPEKTWAVVIGVSNYTDDVEPLRYAASDAQAMADFLMSPRGGGLRPDRVETLLEGDATMAAVKTTLGFLGEKTEMGDSVYVFIAGHGFLTPKKLAYFVPADGTLSNVYASGVNFRELKDLVEENLAHTKVRILMTDICHAGRLGPESTPPPAQDRNAVNEYLSQIVPKAGTFLNLLASRPDEYSFESESLGRGVFTHAILDALNGKSLAPGVTVADTKSVVEFVKTEVPRLTGRQQNPMSNSNFDPGLALAFLDRPGPQRMAAVQTTLVIRNADRVTFERVEWFDSRYKAKGTRRFSKSAAVVQIGGLPAGEMEFKFSSPQNPVARSLKLTLQPGENNLDILAANLAQYRFRPAGPVQLAALQPLVPPLQPTAQFPAVGNPGESTLLFKAPSNATVLLDGIEFTTSVAADEYLQLTGLTPGIHNLTLLTAAREYRFRVRLRAGAQTFIVQTGEMIYAPALPQDPVLAPLPNGVPANLANGYRSFVLALWDERLVGPQGNSAWDFYIQIRNGLPAPLRDDLTQRLAIALGDRAQRTILKYLRGGDIQWDAAVFEEGVALSGRLQEIFQFRPAIQRDIQSRQNFFSGRALVSRGRYPEAIQQLQRSIDLFPEASHSYNAIGLAHWQQGTLDQAIAPLEQAIALTPQWTYPRNILALVLLELRRYDEARQRFQEALQVNPEDSSLNHGLAQLDLQLGRVADAEPRLQRAIDFNPGNAYALATYARLERLRGNLDQAESRLRLAIRLEPDEPSFSAGLADLLRQRGRVADAQQIFNQLARANPSNLSVVRTYTDFLTAQNRLSDARSLLDEAVKAAPKDPNIRVVYGEFLRTQQRGSDAEKQYKEALKAAPSNVFAHYGLANVYLTGGKLDQAEKSIQAAEKADPRYPRSMMLLGQIRSAQKRYPEALDAFDKALALAVEPDQQQEVKRTIEETKRAAAVAAIQSAKNDIEKNRTKSAWSIYTAALKLAPQDPALIATLLKFESDFTKDADLTLLPPSPVAAALQTPFWARLREAEVLWKNGKREEALGSFAGALEMLSAEDRRKLTSTEFNSDNDNYGIHQITYRWASRAIELKNFNGAQMLMDSAIRNKIFDFAPNTSPITVSSLMRGADNPEPTTFAGFDVAHYVDVRAHEIFALVHAGQGNVPRSDEFLVALTAAQQADIRGKIQRLAR
jgi:tetratricopeptide (TPR) repeat protein